MAELTSQAQNDIDKLPWRIGRTRFPAEAMLILSSEGHDPWITQKAPLLKMRLYRNMQRTARLSSSRVRGSVKALFWHFCDSCRDISLCWSS